MIAQPSICLVELLDPTATCRHRAKVKKSVKSQQQAIFFSISLYWYIKVSVVLVDRWTEQRKKERTSLEISIFLLTLSLTRLSQQSIEQLPEGEMHSKHSIIFFTKIFLICILIPHLIKGRKPALLKNIGVFFIFPTMFSLCFSVVLHPTPLSPAPDPLLLVFKESCLLRELKATS